MNLAQLLTPCDLLLYAYRQVTQDFSTDYDYWKPGHGSNSGGWAFHPCSYKNLPSSKELRTHGKQDCCIMNHANECISWLVALFSEEKYVLRVYEVSTMATSCIYKTGDTSVHQLGRANCCCSVIQLYLPLCNPMDCSTPGFPVLPHLLELAQSHVHWVPR